MRAFKHVSSLKEKELIEIFPTAWEFEWQDDESLIQMPFSLWDKWLHEISDDPSEELWVVTPEEKQRREKIFCKLASNIINEYEVFGLFFRQNKFKAVRSKPQLIKDIHSRTELDRPLFIPALAAIYTQCHDFTGRLYIKDEDLGSPIISLVEDSGLKFIV
jgi:hypothetical protein